MIVVNDQNRDLRPANQGFGGRPFKPAPDAANVSVSDNISLLSFLGFAFDFIFRFAFTISVTTSIPRSWAAAAASRACSSSEHADLTPLQGNALG